VGAAHAELGCRRFGRAARLLAEAETAARSCSDVHNLIECETVRTRLLLALGAPAEALRFSLGALERPPSPIQEEEWASVKALAAACTGDLDQCEELLARAEGLRWGRQTIVLGACSRLIAELARRADTSRQTAEVIESVATTGWIDPLVTACRGCPGIVPLLLSDPSFAPILRAALKRSRDHDLLGSEREQDGPVREPEGPSLSKREDEVFALLCQGLTNKEIAKALFISEVTVKVHLRHVYRKLGVRTRLEAVARAGNAVRERPR